MPTILSRSLSTIALLGAISSFLGCSTSSLQQRRPANVPLEGKWWISGAHESRGAYKGILQIKASERGFYEVARVVDYEDLKFEGLRVQEVWTGTGQATEEGVSVRFLLRQADFIAELNGKARLPEEWEPIEVSVHARPTRTGNLELLYKPEGSRAVSKLGAIRENMASLDLALEMPSLKQDREVIAAYPEPTFKQAFVEWVMRDFVNQPALDPYRERPEFKKGVQYLVVDHGDYDFYQKNPKVLRVTNKVIDEISMTEALGRHHAFAPTLAQKAEYYQRNMSRHVNEAGMLHLTAINEKGQVVGEVPNYDATLWTGVYVLSQALRYKQTRDPAALAAMKASLNGLMFLMDVTQNPKEFARTVQARRPGAITTKGKWHEGTGKYSGWLWLERGNNDMYKGLIISFLAAHIFLPESEAAFRAQVGLYAQRLKGLALAQERSGNKMMAYGLSALFIGSKKDLEEYDSLATGLSPWVSRHFDLTFNVVGMLDWSGLHLNAMSLLSQIWIAEKLGRKYMADAYRTTLFDKWKEVSSTQRHILALLAKGLALDAGLVPEEEKKELAIGIERAVWGLRELPAPRPRVEAQIDYSKRQDWCAAPYPSLPWKFLGDNPPPLDGPIQGIYGYPLFEINAWSDNYVWKSSPFRYKLKTEGDVEQFGVDYLFAYWLARYFSVISE